MTTYGLQQMFFQKIFIVIKMLAPRHLISIKTVVLAADKECCAVTLNKCDYIQKVSNIIQDAIKQKKYVETTDNTLNRLKRFKDFLYRYFYKYKHYKEMHPRYEQPGQFFAIRRSQTFESNDGITLGQLKIHPIIGKICKEIISTKI